MRVALERVTSEAPHSLAALLQREDETLDAARSSQVALINGLVKAAKHVGDDVFLRDGILGPLGDWATSHARAEYRPELSHRGRRVKKDANAYWQTEVECIRAMAKGPPAARTKADGSNFAGLAKAGGARPSSSQAYEPRINDHRRAAWNVWAALVGEERKLLVMAHVWAGEDTGGPADRVAASIRRGERDPLPGVLLPPERIFPGLLVAWELGELRSALSSESQELAGREAAARVVSARKRFRDALRRVELDCRPQLLIPAPSLREMESEK